MTVTYNLRIWEIKSARSEVQGHPPPHAKYETSLGYVRLPQNKRKPTNASEMRMTADAFHPLGLSGVCVSHLYGDKALEKQSLN
jgi:hypothetical protein